MLSAHVQAHTPTHVHIYNSSITEKVKVTVIATATVTEMIVIHFCDKGAALLQVAEVFREINIQLIDSVSFLNVNI